MAISLVGTAEVAHIDTSATVMTLTLPGGLQQDDVVYVFASHTDAVLAGVSITSPVGWSTIISGGTNDGYAVFRKVMGASPDSSVDFNSDSSSTRGSAAIAIALRGVDTTTPEDAAATEAASLDPASITTVTNGAWVLSFMRSEVTDAAITAPTSYVNQVDTTANDNTDVTVGGATREIAVAGAENPGAWTGLTSTLPYSATIAVRPAAEVAGGAQWVVGGGFSRIVGC